MSEMFTTITPRCNPCRMLSDVGPLPNLEVPALFAVFGAAAGWGSICLEQSWIKIALFR
jgi:hypothetical protein